MVAYKYGGLPLTPSIAMELIISYLAEVKKPIRRSDLTKFVESRHVDLGGVAVANTESRVMQALRRLVDDGVVSNPALGFYSLIESSNELSSTTEILPEDEGLLEVSSELLTAEDSIGDGLELVYVYFQEAERKLAGFENRSSWPCKVGYTAGSLTTRIISQGLATSMAKLPIVGLVLKTEDGRSLEKVLHSALDMAGCRMEDALGSEWFQTSPIKIAEWYKRFCEANKSLS